MPLYLQARSPLRHRGCCAPGHILQSYRALFVALPWWLSAGWGCVHDKSVMDVTVMSVMGQQE